MAEEIIIVPAAAPVPAGIGFGELVRYAGIIQRVIAAWAAAGGLTVGASSRPGLLKATVSGKEFTWDLGTITRTK